jgi:hypothetical protein
MVCMVVPFVGQRPWWRLAELRVLLVPAQTRRKTWSWRESNPRAPWVRVRVSQGVEAVQPLVVA